MLFARLQLQYNLSSQDARTLISCDEGCEVPLDGLMSTDPRRSVISYFEEICAGGRNPKVVLNWYVN